jgi:hypothetical protein
LIKIYPASSRRGKSFEKNCKLFVSNDNTASMDYLPVETTGESAAMTAARKTSRSTEATNAPSTKSKPLEPPYIEPMTRALKSLAIDATSDQSRQNNSVPQMIRSPQRIHRPYLQDKGLTCLAAQLGRVNDKIRYNNSRKQVLIDFEEDYKRELAASLAKSIVATTTIRKQRKMVSGSSILTTR